MWWIGVGEPVVLPNSSCCEECSAGLIKTRKSFQDSTLTDDISQGFIRLIPMIIAAPNQDLSALKHGISLLK